MLEQKSNRLVEQKYVLTPEQRFALLEGKVKRAEAELKALAEIAKRLGKPL